MTAKKTNPRQRAEPAPSESPVAKYVVSNCTFTAEAGKPMPAGHASAISHLADAVIRNAEAITEIARALKGTDGGRLETGLRIGEP